MDARRHPDYAGWIVTRGDPRPAVMLPRPRRAVVRTVTYGGAVVTIEADVVARARGLVCVRQELPGRPPWCAWVPAHHVRPLDGGTGRMLAGGGGRRRR